MPIRFRLLRHTTNEDLIPPNQIKRFMPIEFVEHVPDPDGGEVILRLGKSSGYGITLRITADTARSLGMRLIEDADSVLLLTGKRRISNTTGSNGKWRGKRRKVRKFISPNPLTIGQERHNGKGKPYAAGTNSGVN